MITTAEKTANALLKASYDEEKVTALKLLPKLKKTQKQRHR